MVKTYYRVNFGGHLISKCKFGKGLKIGSILCRWCDNCIEINTQKNYVICKKYNELEGGKEMAKDLDKVKAIEEQMNKLDSDHKKNMEELRSKLEKLTNNKDDVVKYVKDWYIKDNAINNGNIIENSLGLNNISYFSMFKVESDLEGYVVEKIIEKVIEYYNEGWVKDLGNVGYKFSYEYGDITYFSNDIIINTKLSLYMKSYKITEEVKEVLTNWKGKNLLKYYFTGAW